MKLCTMHVLFFILLLSILVYRKLNSVSDSIRRVWFHSKHHLGKLIANSSSWTRVGCWYSTLLSSPPLISPSPPTSPRRHTRLVGSSLQLFVQADALLWAHSRAFLGVNFNELGIAFPLSASFYVYIEYSMNRCTSIIAKFFFFFYQRKYRAAGNYEITCN